MQLLPLAVLSLVRDFLELNYCTKLFHQIVHALSAQLCKTRRNIGVLRGKHHSHQTAFSIAFFAAFSAFCLHFPAFFANPGDLISSLPLFGAERDKFMCIVGELTHSCASICIVVICQ